MTHAAHKQVSSLASFFGSYRRLIMQRPRLLFAAVFLSFAAALAEGLGLAIIYPIFESLSGTGKLQGPIWDAVHRIALAISRSSVTEGLLLLAVVIFFLKTTLLAMNAAISTLWINRLQSDWRLAALGYYLFGPYAAIVSERRGKIIQNIIGETQVTSNGLQQLLNLITRSVFAVVLVTTLFMLSWKMSAGLLVIVFFLTLFMRTYVLRSVERLGRKRRNSNQAIMAITAEPLFSASTVKLLGAESEVLERLRVSLRKFMRANVLMTLSSKSPSLFVEFIVVAMIAAVFIVLARGFGIPYQQSAPLIGAFAVVSSRLLNVLSSLLSMRLSLATMAASLAVIDKLVNAPVSIELLRQGATLQKIDSDIEFDNVGFGYDNNKAVFTNLSIVFPKGKMTGIVGPTGVGKSTIGHLIARLYEPESGKILINGRDIREFSLESLRRRIGFIEQTPAVFNGTIAENISLGAPGASPAQIEEAAKAAELHNFIMSLPEGYDTIIHDQGSTLSGGERQRLAIARAIVRRPDVFIFDEGTGMLDQKTEALVQRSVHALAGEATVIVIAHRVSALKNADLIYEVLPGGEVLTRSYEEIAA